MTDGQDIFDEDVPATTTEGISPEAPAPADGPARDDQGRFVAKDTGETQEPADAAPADAAPPAAAPKDSGMVPLAVVLDDREKRQRAEQERDQLRAQLAHFQRQQQQPQTLPDPIEDANGYGQFILSQVQQATMANRLQMSRFFAEEKFGAQTVAEAMAWFDNQPRAVSEQFLSAPSPFHAAVAHYQSHKAAEERSSPDYEANLRAKIKAELMAEMAQPSPTPRIPPSMARSGNSGNDPAPAPLNPIFT